MKILKITLLPQGWQILVDSKPIKPWPQSYIRVGVTMMRWKLQRQLLFTIKTFPLSDINFYVTKLLASSVLLKKCFDSYTLALH